MLIGVILFTLILVVLLYCAVGNCTNCDKSMDDEEQIRYIEKWRNNHNVREKNKYENGERDNQ